MERKLPSAADQHHNPGYLSDPEQFEPDSFDCLISYETDIRTWKSVKKSAVGKTREASDPLADLRGSKLQHQRKKRSSVPKGSVGPRKAFDISEEIPVRDSDSDRISIPRPKTLSKDLFGRQGEDGLYLFSPDSLPASPVLSPLSSSGYRTSCSDSEQIVSGDKNTARYLRILKPHKDSASDAEEVCSPPLPKLGASLNISESDPFDVEETLLLESPSESPSHFSRLRLSLSTGESETDTSVITEPNSASISRSSSFQRDIPYPIGSSSKSVKLQEVPSRKRKSAKRLNLQDPQLEYKTQPVNRVPETTFYAPGSEGTKPVLDKAVIHDLESEIKKLVVDIYSEKAHKFIPIPGLQTTRMDPQADDDVTGKDAFSTGHAGLDLSFGPPGPGSVVMDISDELLNSTTSSTSDALALQKSVISDTSAEPASMEEIQAAIEEAQKQYRERLHYHRQQQGKGVETDLVGNSLDVKRSHNGSVSSLDETPTRIPAPSQFETYMANENTLESAPPVSNHQLEFYDAEYEKDLKSNSLSNHRPVTVSKRPTSLVVQNTGLAISSAVAGRIGSGLVDSQKHSDATLYRSPVQAITSSKGGRLMAQKQEENNVPQMQGKKDPRVYASPGDIQANAAAFVETGSEHGSSRASSPSGKGPSNIVTVKAAGDHSVHVQQIGLEPSTGMIITGGHSSDSEQGSNSVPEVSSGDHGHDQKETQKSSSFLGSLFPWGRKTEPATSSHSQSPVPSKDVPVNSNQNLNGDVKRVREHPTEAIGMTESTDSGIDIVPANQSAVDVFHADFSPVHASTPMHFGHKDAVDSPQTQKKSENALNAAYGADTKTETTNQEKPGANSGYSKSRPEANFGSITPPRRLSDSRKGTNGALENQQLQGQSAPVVSMRRRDLSKMPSTSLGRPSGRAVTTSRSEPSRVGGDELHALMRQKAKLEGQLESMSAETTAALQDRANLQSQVASLQVQLQSYSSNAEMVGAERSAMETNLRSVEHHRVQLEEAVMSLQNSLETKEDALDSLRQDLETSTATNQRLQDKLDEIRSEMNAKEYSVADMKGKISALKSDVEKAHEEKARSIAELKVLQSDVQSLVQSKEWFQEQLQFAQDARGKLQQDLANAQQGVKTQTKAVEHLKAENAQVKQELNKTQQQALQEKEQIAKHLETIEADMVAREAAFGAIEREKLAVQEAVASRMDQMEEERHQLGNLIATTVELERQLESTQKQLVGKQVAMKALDAEKSELAKSLAMAQDAVNTRERDLSTLQHRYNDIEGKLNDLLNESSSQDEALHQLQQERAHLEAALSTANAEKRAFDDTLQRLRQDTGRVENSFKQMRQELNQKNEDLEEVQREKEHVHEQLRTAERQLQDQEKNVESYSADLENRNDLVNELANVKATLEKELSFLKDELKGVKNAEINTRQAKKGLEADLRKVSEDFRDLESQLQEALTENAHLEGQLEMMADEQQRFSQLLDENGSLKQKVAELQNNTHRQLGDQKAKILRLGSDLSSTQKDLKTKQKTYDSAVGTLTRKLKEAMEARQASERDLQALQSNTARTSKEEQDRLMAELESARKGLSVVQDQRDRLEQQLRQVKGRMEEEAGAYRERVADLEEELKSLKELCDEQQRNEEANRKQALELERERGRLAGVQQSHHALKQHTSLLEAALGRRESALAEMSTQLSNNSHERASEEDKLRTKLREAEDALRSEKHASKELRKQLASEKGSCGRLQRNLQSKTVDLDETKKDLDRKLAEVDTTKGDLEKTKETEVKQQSELQQVKAQLETSRDQLERLKRQMQQVQAKDPVVKDQIKGLTWENEQKMQETEALKEQLELAERRQQIELDGAQSAVQMSKQELGRTKTELAGTRKEKFAFQTKNGQLKAALRATLQQNKLLKSKLKAKIKAGQRSKPSSGRSSPQPDSANSSLIAASLRDDVVVPELVYDVEALLGKDDVDSDSTSNSKPLQSIQGCMSSLKGQMNDLQQQMTQHTAAVNKSNEDWREVESKVRDLRKACTPPTSAAKPRSVNTSVSNSDSNVSSRSSQQVQETALKSSMSAPSYSNVQDV